MDPIPDALEALYDDVVSWLAGEERALVIGTPASMRERVLEFIRVAEHHPRSRSPFVVCEAGHRKRQPGWRERSKQARAEHQRRCEAAGGSIATLPAEASLAADSPAGFAATLASLLAVTPPGAQGLVLVLAPRELRDPPGWTRALKRLLDASGLEAVRWIVVDVDDEPSSALFPETPGHLHRVEIGADAPAKLLARLADADEGPTGARSTEPAPPHPSAPTLRAPTQDVERRREIRRSVLGAAAAAHEGDSTAAVVRQARAVALAHEAGLVSEAITLQTMLGTLLLASGASGRAIEAFETAATQAAESQRPELAATARLAMGCARQTQGDRHRALVDHAEATVAAEQGGSSLLAIEAARSTGQLAAELGMETQAVVFFGKAVVWAEKHPELAALGSGPIAARALATLSRRRGLGQRADQLEERAEKLEAAPIVAVEPEATIPPAPAPEQPAPAPPSRSSEEPEEPEGTEFLPVEVLASMHGWSADDVDRIKRLTEEVLDEEVTSMLTAGELDALRGDGPMPMSPTPLLPLPELPPPPAPVPPAPMEPRAPEPPPLVTPPDLPAAGDALSAALAKMAALRDVEIEDEVSHETRIHERVALPRTNEDGDPDPDSQ